MIECESLSKDFGKFEALSLIDFSLAIGETAVIVGPSGSGKTTLLRLIAGLDAPTEGRVLFQGKIASSASKILIQPFRRNLSMIFQDLALWPHLKVWGNLEFPLKSRKLQRFELKKRIEEVAEWVGLSGKLETYPHELSGGERQRVAIARALVTQPHILLLDEPLNNLDAVLREEILELLMGLTEDFQMTLLYVTHNREEAFRLNGRVLVLEEGRLIQSGTAESIEQNPKSEFIKKFFRRE
jgi:iron(III) transport system ATP-binding protein